MSVIKFPNLFEPLEIRGVMFRNRLWASPQGSYTYNNDGLMSDEAIAFLERKAIGGFGAVCVSEGMVSSRDKLFPFLLNMDDPRSLPSLSAAAFSISRHGSVPTMELNHHGMYSQAAKNPLGSAFVPGGAILKAQREGRDLESGVIYGPVDIENGKYGPVRAMDEEYIENIIRQYAYAAQWAQRAGYQLIHIHGGHGWLLSQFMSPQINTRKDKWGGSLENRMRLPLAIIDAVRKACGNKMPVEFRYSASECDPNGYDIDEGVRIAKMLDEKVDIIHCSAGNHELEETFIITHPSMFLEDGVNSRYAAEVKKAGVKSLVATVGAFTDPAQMEEIIASGKADIVELGRQTLADPDLPLKARRGQEEDINKCLRCFDCFVNHFARRILRCPLNPALNKEREELAGTADYDKKKVLVIGGGVGGMETALTAAKRGHEVVLLEKKDVLGGVLTCEEKIPFKVHLDEYIKKQAKRVANEKNIDLRISRS